MASSNNNFYYMSSASNNTVTGNFNWTNNEKPNENFYGNSSENLNGFAANNTSLIKPSTSNGERIILQNDQMLYSAANANCESTQTPNYGFEDAENDNPFVSQFVKSESSSSNTYNGNNKYYDPAASNNFSSGYNSGGLLDSTVNSMDNQHQSFMEDGYSINYSSEQNEEILNTAQDYTMNHESIASNDSNITTSSKRKSDSTDNPFKKKGRPLKDPNAPPPSSKKKKDPNAPPVKKGRPCGSRNKTLENIPKEKKKRVQIKKPPSENTANTSVENKAKKIIPRMTKKVHTLRLNPEQIEEAKKSQMPFLQPGLCYQIAPNLDHCLECCSMKHPHWRNRIKQKKKEIDCRFFEFRKLVYSPEGELKVYGYLDPYNDPAEVDDNIWLPSQKRLERKGCSVQQSRLILNHISDSFCEILIKEQEYIKKYKLDPDKNLIWKRLIRGVREICDLCSTTLFNHHFICTRCGFSCCIDCYEEHKEDSQYFDFVCSNKKEKKTHEHSDLSFTQMSTANSLEEIQKMFHECCSIWNIEHNCKFMRDVNIDDPMFFNFARNTIDELEIGRSILTKELADVVGLIDIDKEFFTKLNLEDQSKKGQTNNVEDIQKHFHEHCEFLRTKYHKTDYQKSLIYDADGKDYVKNPSRILTPTTSSHIYPDVPHNWLCNGRLLRLKDPNHPKNDEIFHDQWERGQPIIVSGVDNCINRDLWIPQSFTDEFGRERADLINCLNGNLVQDQPISIFWNGFEEMSNRLKDKQGTPMLLKLKDWPPDEDCAKIMPSRFEDLMKVFPMNAYTNRIGELNLVRNLPGTFIIPDLGPKMYNAYGSPFHPTKGTTNLHLDVSDAANIMVYVGIPTDETNIDEYIAETYKTICEADCDLENRKRLIKNGDIPGAIWHIYEANDSDKIRDFLIKIAEERDTTIEEHHDPIHDQNWYLDGALRKRLFEEYGVKGYAFVQYLGDAVFIPAGTPHQVRNIFSCIKVAEDFVSPENISHCLHLSKEFRKLSKTHTNNEDKLQIKSVVYHSVKDVMQYLTHYVQSKRYLPPTFVPKVIKSENAETNEVHHQNQSVEVEIKQENRSQEEQDSRPMDLSENIDHHNKFTFLNSAESVQIVQNNIIAMSDVSIIPVSNLNGLQ